MENICIKPVNDDVRLHVEALNIKNEFIRKGFDNVSGFVGVVQNGVEEYKDYKKVKRLLAFWAGRVKDEELNQQLLQLLETLKSE